MEHNVEAPKVVGAYANYEVVTETLRFHFVRRERAEVFANNLQHVKAVECICES